MFFRGLLRELGNIHGLRFKVPRREGAIRTVPLRLVFTPANDRCIHCAQCVDSCPTDAMQMDQKFEIAAFDRHDLKMAWEFVRAVVKIKLQA